MTWKIELLDKEPKLNKPVLIEGLPGIGNVGKVAIDFIIDELKAKKLYRISSFAMPHSVFVNENNLVELPSIEMYYKQFNDKNKPDLLLLAGDVQPIDEVSAYEFSSTILDIAKKHESSEVITLGGIGLPTAPKNPRVYCTANCKEIIKRYKNGTNLNDHLYGVVGPIIGVSGLLLGLAERRKIKAISFLAETMGHPMYLGVKGAREIIKVLNTKLRLNIDMENLDTEIKEIEREFLKLEDKDGLNLKKTALRKIKGRFGKEVSYIG